MSFAIALAAGHADSAERVLSSEVYAVPVAELMVSASEFAQREAQAGSAGLGAVPSSIVARATPMGARVSTSLTEAIVLETGRRAGAKLPPLAALSRYAPTEQRYPLARAIAQRGIRGRFFMRKAHEALDRSELPRLIEKAQQAIAARWSEE